MAEALGIASAIVSLGEASLAAMKIVQHFRDTPDELLAIHNEIVDLQTLAARMQRVTEHDLEAAAMLKQPLQIAMKYANDLKGILHQVGSHMTAMHARWFCLRHRAMKLQARLRESRRSLNDELTLLSVHTNLRFEMSIMDSVKQVAYGVQDQRAAFDQALISRTGILHDERVTAPTCTRTLSYPQSMCVSKAVGGPERSVVVCSKLVVQRDCSPHCCCCCHRPSQWGLRISKILGSLFVGYSGVPSLRKRCDIKSCGRETASTCMTVSYSFPSWFMAKAFSFNMYARPFQSMTVNIHIQNVVTPHDQIMIAVKSGDNRQVQGLLAKCPSHVNDIDYNGRTVLQRAVYFGQLSTVKLLLQQGATIDFDNLSRLSPLVTIFPRYCLSHDERPFWHECASHILRTMIDDLPEVHKIVLGLHHADLASFLNRNPRAVRITDNLGRTALYWAAATSSVNAVRTLLEYGADVSAKDNYGYTVVYGANEAEHPSLDIVNLIIEQKPDTTPNEEGRSIVHFAASMKDAACRRALLHYVVAQGVDLNAKSVYWWTPLTFMAYSACSEPMAGLDILLNNRADIDMLNKAHRTAIFKAVDQERPENAEVLLRYGADHLVVERFGDTLLHIAARFAVVETFKVLFRHGLAGLDALAVNNKGETAINIFEEYFRVHDDYDSLSEVFYRLIEKIQFPHRFEDYEKSLDGCSGTSSPFEMIELDDGDEEEQFLDAVEVQV